MKVNMFIYCVLAMVLLNSCQGIRLNQTVPGEVTIEKDMKMGMEMEMEMRQEMEHIFPAGEQGLPIVTDEIELIKLGIEMMKGLEKSFPVGEQGTVLMNILLIEGNPRNSTNVANDTKDAKEINKERSKDKEVPISMQDDDKVPESFSNLISIDQIELKEANAGEAGFEEEMEMKKELDLEEANEEKTFYEMVTEEIKEILEYENHILDHTDNRDVSESITDKGPTKMIQGMISDDEAGDDDENEGSGVEDQAKNIETNSEKIEELENEMILEENIEEIEEEIESIENEDQNSEIRELQQEEDNILDEMDILKNTLIEMNEAPVVHSAIDDEVELEKQIEMEEAKKGEIYATKGKEPQLYSQTTMKFVYFISAGILMLSVLILLIALLAILTKKENGHGNPAPRYFKLVRLMSSKPLESKEALV